MQLTSKSTKRNGSYSCFIPVWISNCAVQARKLIAMEITCIQEQFCSLPAGVSGKININDFSQRISSQGL